MLFILSGLDCLQAQQMHLRVTVLDSLDGDPLYGATVSIQKHRHVHITDASGIAVFDSLQTGQLLMHVSYIGYHHLDKLFTLSKDNQITVLLCPESYHLHESIVLERGMNKELSNRTKQVLNESDVARKQGQNISELLSNINGVTLLSSSGGISKPVIRGLHSQRLVTIQGNSRIEGQQWGEDHGPEIDPFSASRVEVIKGAASVEFGPEAIGGVIKILPRPWLADPGVKGLVQTGFFTNNKQGAGSLLLEGRLGKEKFMAWRAQGSMRKAGDSRAPDYNLSNTGYDENSQAIALAFGYKKFLIETNFTRYQTKQGIFVASHLGNMDDLNRALKASQPLIILPFTYQIGKPFQQVQHILFSAKMIYSFPKKSILSLTYSQQVNSRQEFDADRIYNQALQGKPALDFEIQSFTTDLIYECKWANHWNAKIGSNILWQHNTLAGLQFIIPPFKSFTSGLYAILRKDLYEGSIAFGLRYDIRILDLPTYTRFNKQYAYHQFYNSPAFVVTYSKLLKPTWVFNATLSSGWRPPAVNELYSYGLHYGIASFEMGDSLLMPERTYLMELSLHKQNKNWSGEITFFSQYFNGFIYRKPMAEPTLTIRGAFPTFQFAQCNALLLGSELSIAYRPEIKLYGAMMLSYLYAQNLSLGEPLLFMPANRIQLQLGYTFSLSKKIIKPYFELQGIGVNRQNRYTPGIDYQDPPAAYALLHVNGGFGFKPYLKSEIWQVHLSCQNLLNQNYKEYLSRFRYFTNETGVNFILRLQVPF